MTVDGAPSGARYAVSDLPGGIREIVVTEAECRRS